MTPLARNRCVYTKGWVCMEHEEGARKHLKPLMSSYTGPNGEERRKMTGRKIYCVCDTDIPRRRRLRQTKISFGRMQGGGETGGDTSFNNLGKNLGELSTCTEGQMSGPAMEKMSDEN